jgi:IPT/TIG domain
MGNFSLSLSSSQVNVAGGASGSISVAVVGSNGFSGGVTFSLSGVPSEITVSPASFELTAGQSQQITFTAPPWISASASTITIDGNSGPGFDHSTNFSLQLSPYQGNISLPRTRYLRTDAVDPATVIFDSQTDRFIMSDPGSNELMFIDAATRAEVGTVTVPGAYGMDETPDHTTLYVGTEIGDVYAVDPVGMTVKQRYIASQIGASGFQAASVRVLANGNLVLIPEGIANSIDGFDGFAVWNPGNNSLALYEGGSTNSVGPCVRDDDVELTADRSTVILSGLSICTVNPVTGQVNTALITGWPVVATPDGTSLLVFINGTPTAQLVALDPSTLQQQATMSLINPAPGNFMVVSPDSKTVFLASGIGGAVYAYDIATGNMLGWIPNVAAGQITTWISAMDNTGLLAGVLDEGMGLLDTAAMRTGTVGQLFLQGEVPDPETGPVAGGTSVSFVGTPNLAAVYFGSNLGTVVSQNPGYGQFTVATPPNSAGVVDVYGLMTDGGVEIVPQGFSYGPTILKILPDSSTAEGGETGTIIGYGFGPASATQVPAGLQVTVGGASVPVTSLSTDPNSWFPFNIQVLSYTIPAGAAGTSADVTLTSSSGTATVSGGMRYLPAVQQIPVSGAALAQGIYDSTRDLYYFTDAAEIRVYSKSQNQWLAPIQVPAAPSGSTHRLWGIALSPSGSALAVSDPGTGMVYLINPDATGSVQSFALNSLNPQASGPLIIAGLAISDAGMIYVTTVGAGDVKINATTGQITRYSGIGAFNGPMSRAVITSDNSKVYFNNDGAVLGVDTATDAVTYAADGPGCCYGDYDLTLASGQDTLEGTGYLFDLNLNAESYLTMTDEESWNISYVYGTKLSPDGTLLFQPTTSGIDIYDGRLGTLLTRIALPVALSQNFDALVSDGEDNVLVAITGQAGSGIAIVDLSSVSEPAPLPYRVSGLRAAAFDPGTFVGSSAAHRSTIRHVANELPLRRPFPKR